MSERDALALRGPNNCCVICGLCVCEEHSLARCTASHLADGSAVVVKEYGRTDRVVPSTTFPETREPIPSTSAPLLRGRMRVVRGRRFRP